MKFVTLLCALFVGVALSARAADQEYPTKVIRMIVPYPPGGPTDLLGRIIAQGLNEAWRQPVVVENRAGAAGNIGTEYVARAAPDGYTLLVNSGPTMGISASLYSKLAYDPIKDFEPVTLAIVLPNILVVHPSVPATSVKELIALLKAHPGKMTFASAGTGTVGHMAGELFKLMAGVDMVHVPYKGAAPAIADVIGGQVDMFFDTIANSLPHVKAGKLRMLAVSSSRGSPLLPGVPTISEAGLPGFDANPSFGVFVPATTPRLIVEKIQLETAKVLTKPRVKEQLENQGAEIVAGTPDDFSRYMKDEYVKWKDVIVKAGIKLY
jgi:tripartite-type tricarboxylate transporter receptor subunit TctC